MMKRALIVGVSGQDGSYLAEKLLDKRYEVYGTSRDAQISPFSNLIKLRILERVNTLSLAVNDFRSVLQVITEVQPDEIYNLSGQTSVGLSFAQPVETMESISGGVLNFLEAIRFLGKQVKYYNACSSECFGDTSGYCADEFMPFKPSSPYAVAKSTAFWLVDNYRKAYGLFACSGILYNHESSLRPERFVTKKIVATACRIFNGSKERLRLGNIEIRRDWGWAPEYVEAMWLMLQRERPDDYVIATGEAHSLKEFVAEVFSSLHLDWDKYVDIDNSLLRPVDIKNSCGNANKAFLQLGWKADFKMTDVVREMIRGELESIREDK